MKRTVVIPSVSSKSSSISWRLSSPSQVQVNARRLGGSISVYLPRPPYSTSLRGSRMTTRTSPPTRRSTFASVVSQSRLAWNQRRSTSSLVQASKTAWAGAW